MSIRRDEPSDDELRRLLATEKRITVIGLSADADRPSYGVSRYLIEAGYDLRGVRPGDGSPILGRPCYPALKSVPGRLGIVDVFRKPDAIPGVVDEILTELERRPPEERPTLLWLQKGITHPQAEARARAAGLKVVSDRCLLVEHARLF